MEFNEFSTAVKTKVGDFLGENVKITEKEVLKNNGVLLKGLIIQEGNNNCAPNIYLNDYYEEYKYGKAIHDIVYEISTIYEKNKVLNHVDMGFFMEYENVKKRILFKLIHYNENAKLLKDVPYIPFLDLAIVFYCTFFSDQFGNGSIMIRNEHIKQWNITAEELLEKAKENTPKVLHSELTSMEEMICEMLKEKIKKQMECCIAEQVNCEMHVTDEMMEPIIEQLLLELEDVEQAPAMYILTNQLRTFGAVTILYQDILMNFAKEHDADIFILPSSVHEMILIPVSPSYEIEHLKEMVQEVNQTQVGAEGILSNSIYYFERKTGIISMA